MSRTTTLTPLLALCAALAAGGACAQQATYPDKPVRIVVPLSAGGPVDTLMRTIAEGLGTLWKQPVVVENKPGAAGNLGAAEVARAAPDGYTLLGSIDTVFTVNPTLYPKLGYDQAAIVPVAQLTSSGQMLVVNPASGIKSMKELIAQGRARELTYSSAGNGSPAHLASTLLSQATGLSMLHVPYKGAAPAVTAILAGEVDMGILPVPAVLAYLKAGRLRGLAVTGDQSSPLAPEIPTMAEAGVTGVRLTSEQSLYAPAGLPAAIQGKLEADLQKVLKMPAVIKRIAAVDQRPTFRPGPDYAVHLKETADRLARVIRTSGMAVE